MRFVLKLFIISLPFFNFFAFPNISFADIGLVILVVFLFFSDKKSMFETKTKEVFYFYLLFLWILISSFILLLDQNNNFVNEIGLVKNGMRFLLIAYIYINIKYIFKTHRHFRYLIKIWERVLYFVCFLALIEYCLQFLGIYYSYYFEGITTTTSKQSNEIFRISSIFNEPSYLVIYLTFSLLVISDYYSKNKKQSTKSYKKTFFIIGLIIFLAKSLVGIILFVIIIFSYSEIILGKKLIYKKSYSVTLILVLISSSVLIYVNYDRISKVISVSDGSANHRFLGSIELTKFIFDQGYIYTGVGLGQQRHYLSSRETNFQNHFFSNKRTLQTGSGINNMFVLVFFQLGLIGIVLYLTLIYTTFKNQKKVLLFVLASGFGWGIMFNPLYWFCLSILNILINGRKKDFVYLH